MSGSVTQCLDCHSNVWAGTKVCPECGSNNIAITLREAHRFYTDKLHWQCNYCPEVLPNFKELVEHYKSAHEGKLKKFSLRNKNGDSGIVRVATLEEAARFFGFDIY